MLCFREMVSENSLNIEGLKKTVDFACNEINDIKDKVNHFETRLNCHKSSS